MQINSFTLVNVHLDGLLSLFPVPLANSYGALAQIQWCIPTGGEKLMHQRICKET